MVYCGKPSRGCQNCKTRRIKCDEVRPCCTQCKKSSRSCPGYPDEFDLIFRNETLAVKRRAQRALSANKNGKAKSTKKQPPLAKSNLTCDTTVKLSPSTESSPADDDSPGGARRSRLATDSISTPTDALSSATSTKAYVDSPTFAPASAPSVIDSPTIFDSPAIFDSPTVFDSPAFFEYSPRSETSSGALLPYSSAVKKWERSPTSDYIPHAPYIRSLDMTTEATAITFFLQHHANRPRTADSQRGFLEHLPPLYQKASTDSLLHRATYALSMGALSNARHSPVYRLEARRTYAKALKELGEVIKKPRGASSNETLMTILLFSLYEQITWNTSNKTQWTSHIHGAIALLKMRGWKQLESDPVSKTLFKCVRTQMINAAIQKGGPCEAFPDEQGWLCDQGESLNSANRLTIATIELPTLRFYAQQLAKPTTPKTPETILEILGAVRRAQDLDRRLEEWARTLPAEWRSEVAKVVTEEPREPLSAFFWSGPVYVYGDLNIANVMNEYRISRLLCQSIVLACVGALPTATAQAEHLQRSYTEAVYIAQQMVNEVCSTVPFMLGFNLGNRLDGESDASERALQSTGAYFAGPPLFIAKAFSCIRPKQRQWLLGRLIHIGREFGLTEAGGEGRGKTPAAAAPAPSPPSPAKPSMPQYNVMTEMNGRQVIAV